MKLKQRINKKKPFIDAIIVIMSLVALSALFFINSNDQSRMEQLMIANSENNYQWIRSDRPLYEMIEYLVINEVNQAGWIELYNRSMSTGIELSTCYIAVNGKNQYTFDEMDVIHEGELLCIEGLGQLGSSDHDIIGIFDKYGNNLNNIMIPNLERGESYGCLSEGDIQYGYLTASKGLNNSKSDRIIKDQLVFSVPGGFYDESFLLEITAAEGMTIHYTLDGSEPTEKDQTYSEPIIIENRSGSNIRYATVEGIDYLYSYKPSSISMGMVVRAIAVDSKGMKSEIETQSYFVGLKDANDIKNIPILSITTTPEYLFDYFEGIYVTGRSHEDALARGEDGREAANYLNGWERKVYVEYFEPQKDKTYQGHMLISVIKDKSINSPQKSFLFTAEGGAFSGSSLMTYYNNLTNRLVVKTNGVDNNYKIREYLAGRLLADTTVGTLDIIPCIVFINGEYWGAYMLCAEYDEYYIEKHYDVAKEEVLIAKKGVVSNKEGYQEEYDEVYGHIFNKDLKDEENYRWVKDHLDIQNYLEYICANMFLANAEYGKDIQVMWRTINEQGTGYEDGKWRFLMPRLDNIIKNEEEDDLATSSVNTYLQYGISRDPFFQSLIRNDEFRHQLGVVMTHMVDNIFTEERVKAFIQEISQQMKKMVEVSYRRFIGNPKDSFYSSEVDKIEGFFLQREMYILRYTEEIISQGGISNDGDNEVSE